VSGNLGSYLFSPTIKWHGLLWKSSGLGCRSVQMN
jgi:hypothetical protein